MEMLGSVVGSIISSMAEYCDYHKDADEHVKNLKRKWEVLESRKEDIESRLEAELRRGKKQKKEVELWLGEEVGIPEPTSANGCKLVLTTRNLNVCVGMSCKSIKMELLSKEEARKLFLDKLGHDVFNTPNLKAIAEEVLEKCAQLPLAIVTIAASFKCLTDDFEWRDALEELRTSLKVSNNKEQQVLEKLKFSYDRLENERLKQCLLHCALHPEDYKIGKQELIEHLIDEGIIERRNSRQAEFDRGYSMLKKLENACLLEVGIYEYSSEKFVKMHDLVRDMVLWVASPQFKVEGHLGLEDFSDEGKWREDLVKASLMYNNISRIPPNASPMCPKLSTLLLQGNKSLKDVPDSLFEHLHGLNILDLSNTGIESLPNSVSNLENLTTLRLGECWKLKHVPSLAKLTKLRKLDLEIQELRKYLMYLTVFSKVKAEEVASLKNLETFGGRFFDLYKFSTYMEKGKLPTYEIHVGSIRDLVGSIRGKKELSLEGLGLSAVPSEVWESGEVIKVNLSRNAIQELPVELSSCISLQTLVLSRNKIKDWPGAILKSLPNLSCLKLDNNPLGQIPADGFQAVSRVQVLDLSGNAASLPEHPVFSSIPHLQELYLRRIQLHEVPSDIFSLQQLRILDLSQNSLQSVPVEFQHLTSLTELDLSDNNIAVLPPELGLLEPNLQALRLDGNPLRSLQLPTRKRALT
uniref:Uncharacterized protein n=1 Tax=Fagus sylvatica TaxID=28930 RepID=A0A2N9IJ56_FAGSY